MTSIKEEKEQLKLKINKDVSIILVLSIYTTFNPKSVLTPQEVSNEISINQRACGVVLRKLNKLKLKISVNIL